MFLFAEKIKQKPNWVRRDWLGIVVLMSVMSFLVACEVHQQEFFVENQTSLSLDVVMMSSDFPRESFNPSHYAALELGEHDEVSVCSFCELLPHETRKDFWPFGNDEITYVAAVDSSTRSFLFYERFTTRQLEALDWTIIIVDQRP